MRNKNFWPLCLTGTYLCIAVILFHVSSIISSLQNGLCQWKMIKSQCKSYCTWCENNLALCVNVMCLLHFFLSHVLFFSGYIHGHILSNHDITWVVCTLTLSQCTLAGPVYTGMPLIDPVYTGIPLGHPANTCRVHWITTGKTYLKQPHTGMPLVKLSWNRPQLGCHWTNFNVCSLHWNTTGGTVTAHTRPDTYS